MYGYGKPIAVKNVQHRVASLDLLYLLTIHVTLQFNDMLQLIYERVHLGLSAFLK